VVDSRTVRYIVSKEIHDKRTLGTSIIFIVIGVLLTISSGDLRFVIGATILLLLLLLSENLKEYERLTATNHTPTPLNILTFQYVEITNKLDELKFIDTNKEEISKLEIALEEYNVAIGLIR